MRVASCQLPVAGKSVAPATGNRQPATSRAERGFTLAGLIVICTVIMIFVAYTVPRQWSIIMKREREKQTMFVMKQYARSIKAFQVKNNSLPTSLDQLKKARTPRLIRGVNGEWEDPLTGKVDWQLVPPSVGQQPRTINSPLNPQQPTQTQTTGTTRTGQAAPIPTMPKDYVGPFIGVRPTIEGESLLEFNGAQRYEEWLYTTLDLDNEINGLLMSPNPQQQNPRR